MIIPRILVGVALAALGRKLFWLFVAGIGFVAALNLAAQLLRQQPDWLIILLALVAGLIGAVLAVFLQKMAVGLAGFLAGGYFVLSLLNMFGFEMGRLSWLPFLLGGLIGAVLVAALFDWALIILSSLTGASLIAPSLHLGRPITLLAFAGVFVFGVVVQAMLLRAERRAARAQ